MQAVTPCSFSFPVGLCQVLWVIGSCKLRFFIIMLPKISDDDTPTDDAGWWLFKVINGVHAHYGPCKISTLDTTWRSNVSCGIIWGNKTGIWLFFNPRDKSVFRRNRHHYEGYPFSWRNRYGKVNLGCPYIWGHIFNKQGRLTATDRGFSPLMLRILLPK